MSMLTNTSGLTIEAIADACPSVITDHPHEDRSNRYLFISTANLLAGLLKEGFVPTQVVQTIPRDPKMAIYAKHMVRIRHQNYLGDRYPDVPEICIVNSFNGQCSYQVLLGLFRYICQNGMVMGAYESPIRIKHQGNILDNVIEATYSIVDEGQKTLQVVEAMKQITLSRPEQLLLAQQAMYARFDDENPKEGEPEHKVVAYRPGNFLRVRRVEDTSPDLHTTLQVIQENILPRENVSRYNRVRAYDQRGGKHTLQSINEIDKNNKLNSLLWGLAEGMMKIKQG